MPYTTCPRNPCKNAKTLVTPIVLYMRLCYIQEHIQQLQSDRAAIDNADSTQLRRFLKRLRELLAPEAKGLLDREARCHTGGRHGKERPSMGEAPRGESVDGLAQRG